MFLSWEGSDYPGGGYFRVKRIGMTVSDFVSVSHIFAFLSSHYTFSSWTRILRCQSWRVR